MSTTPPDSIRILCSESSYFLAHRETLEPQTCETYDPYLWQSRYREKGDMDYGVWLEKRKEK